LDKVLYEGGKDIPLKPYDIVYVPKTFIAKVGDFVAQYIDDVIPRAVRLGFTYRLDDYQNETTRNIVIED
jgi:hypothetical protein